MRRALTSRSVVKPLLRRSYVVPSFSLSDGIRSFSTTPRLSRKASVEKSLATRFPDIAAQWHPTHNGDITPDQVVAGSNTKFWFKCNEGPDHEWEAYLSSRTKNASGCPFCASRKVSVTNSLATRFPDVAAQWHPTRNGDITPDQVVAGSHSKFWFKCAEGPDHEWEVALKYRTGKDAGGCRRCAVLRHQERSELMRTQPRKFPCTLGCGYVFTNLSSLYKHVQSPTACPSKPTCRPAS